MTFLFRDFNHAKLVLFSLMTSGISKRLKLSAYAVMVEHITSSQSLKSLDIDYEIKRSYGHLQ